MANERQGRIEPALTLTSSILTIRPETIRP
jgi:hypothetical protein